jgi:hypothetical protein
VLKIVKNAIWIRAGHCQNRMTIVCWHNARHGYPAEARNRSLQSQHRRVGYRPVDLAA